MPRRPREHRVGDSAEPALREILGEDYLYRAEHPDYGLDGSVEEFKEDLATGLRYLVQLKGTDATGSRALARSVDVETLQYWGTLSLPVLLVRHVSKDERIYGRWFHGLGLRRRPADQKTATVRWRSEDELEPNCGRRLADEARAFLDLRSATLPLPLAFGLEAAGGPGDLAPTQLRIAVEHALGPRTDVIRLVQDRPAGAGRLLVEADRLAVELASQVSVDYELDGEYDVGPGGRQLAIDLIALAGLALARWGQADAASRIAHSYFVDSTLATNLEAAMMLASEMARTRRVREALEIADLLDENPEAGDAAFALTLPTLFHAKSLTQAEVELHEGVLERRIQRREERGDHLEASRACINLANHHRFQVNGAEAAALYERAGEHDPDYLRREHYWREYGGGLFFAKRFAEAAEAYDRAVALGSGWMTELLRADSLMFAGRYDEARDEFRRLLAKDGDDDFGRYAEYALKELLLNTLIETLGIGFQDRDTAAADRLVDSLMQNENADPESARAMMTDALRADGLHGIAWWNLAHAHRGGDTEPLASSMFVAAALCLENDPPAWALGTVLTWFHGDIQLVPYILVTGQRLTAGHLLLQLSDIAAQNYEGDELEGFLQEIDRVIADLGAQDDEGFIVRGIGPGSEVSISEFPGATTARDA